jgi:N,N-dimethylformamidase
LMETSRNHFLSTPASLPHRNEPDLPTYQDVLDKIGISGYADAVSVVPGGTVGIKVSTQQTEFLAELVRITHGDSHPDGPGIKETIVAHASNGKYRGNDQRLPRGSYVSIADSAELDLSGSFTLTAWIAPTTIPGSDLNPLAQRRTPAGSPRPQAIISKWSGTAGYALTVTETGSVGLLIGDDQGNVARYESGTALYPYAPGVRSVESSAYNRTIMTGHTAWYFVAAVVDAESRKVTIYQIAQKGRPNPTTAVAHHAMAGGGAAANSSPLLIGAGWGEGEPVPSWLFNGKIARPALFGRALDPGEIERVRQARASSAGGALAAWAFERDISGRGVIDAVGAHHGQTHNTPARAVTGPSWRLGSMDWKTAPDQYDAIYFHESDRADAGWETNVSFRIPDDAQSGMYAARLRTGEATYHAVFTVLPKAFGANQIAFVVPTFSYLAYSSAQYDKHWDGSGVLYSHWHRPHPVIRPYATGYRREGVMPWTYDADSHIVDWLEARGYMVDFITDHDIHQDPALLSHYRVLITATHPEYISEQIWTGMEAYLTEGGRLMYMGGNGFYWVTSLSADGRYTEVRRHDGSQPYQVPPAEYYHSTTGEFGGLWRFRGYAPQELVGVGFTAQGFAALAGPGTHCRPYDVLDDGRSPAGAWVFEGVDTTRPIGGFPSLVWPGGPAGLEIDRVDYSQGTPATTLVLAVATGFGDEYQHIVEEVSSANGMQGGTVNHFVRADMALRYYPNGGAVWSSGSIAWSGSLSHNNYENAVSKITQNVLDMFVSGAALPHAPGEVSLT